MCKDNLVNHKKYGDGEIIKFQNQKIHVAFEDKKRIFLIDDFDKYFVHNNKRLNKYS